MRKYHLWISLLSALTMLGCGEEVIGNADGDGDVVPVCGNGELEASEDCDDGNTLDGDGCSADCAHEEGEDCDGTDGDCGPSVDDPKPTDDVCGNGKVSGAEACDDGNTADGDGCSADCAQVESGFDCPVQGGACVAQVFCGNGVIDAGEDCDDGNAVSGDGCSETCHQETGFTCEMPGYSCRPNSCGDGIVDAGEWCDKGAENIAYSKTPSGCGLDCQPVHYCGDGKWDLVDRDNGEECDSGGYFYAEDYDGCNFFCKRVNYCGDGQITHKEKCDDGNAVSGDGCSAQCEPEIGFLCQTNDENRSECRAILCGNGVLDTEAGEVCDDGNRVAGDGCSASCLLEKGWICEADTSGHQVCHQTCGNGLIDEAAREQCDDGNTADGDGCNSQCQPEAGYICELAAGGYSVCLARSCGDGILAGVEECDDGNAVSNDGCSMRCKRELGWHCQTPGTSCYRSVCGDGAVEGDEKCDEGTNTTAGCVDCQIQAGWQCLTPGAACTHDAVCGNGKLEGSEICDEGTNTTAGCVDCQIQAGWRCATVGAACEKGRCGDKILDAGEECDDGNDTAGDGCSPICEMEAIFECKDGVCKPTCGDGLTLSEAGEECDDGNLTSGDGCSAQCKKETGFTCQVKEAGTPSSLNLPIVYRDFIRYTGKSSSKPADGYLTQEMYDALPAECKTNSGYRTQYFPAVGRPSPDFYSYCPDSNCHGAVLSELGADGKPELAPPSQIHGAKQDIGNYDAYGNSMAEEVTCRYLYTCPAMFKWWYTDVPGINRTIKTTLPLKKKAGTTDTYEFSNSSFFPLGEQGYGLSGSDGAGNGEFTSEFQTYFKYKGGEVLTFDGDDDVWVFFNGRLGVDVGGIHPQWQKSITLDEATAASRFGMYPGGIYSLNMFHAERCRGGSSYKLTISGFVNMGQSSCNSVCGDGIVRGSEECDYEGNPSDAALNRKYGCTKCKLTPFCGNGLVESGEGCDTSESWCKNCKIASCGNGTFEPEHEQCDLSAPASETNRHHACLSTCRLSGCGDGYIDTERGEQCDDGNHSDDDMCTSKCEEPRCGDGIITPSLGEVCDDGKNDGSYGGCGLGCGYMPPRCGDGTIDKLNGEMCDDGDEGNIGGYGMCNSQCQYTEYCGDGIVQPEYETCDDAENNGKGTCSRSCHPAVN